MYFKLWTLKPGNLGIMAGHLISWLNFAYPIAQALSPISDGGFKGFLRYSQMGKLETRANINSMTRPTRIITV